MSIQDWGAIGEFVGGPAVIATLVYLAMQIRQTQRIMRAQAFQGRSEALMDLAMRAAESESISAIYEKLRESNFPANPSIPDTVTPLERQRFSLVLEAHIHRFTNLIHQYEAGMLSDEYYEGGIKMAARNFYPYWKAFGVLQWGVGLERVIREIAGDEGRAERSDAPQPEK